MSNTEESGFQYDIPIDAFKRRRVCVLIALVILPTGAFISSCYACLVNEPNRPNVLAEQWQGILIFSAITGCLSAAFIGKIFLWLDIVPGNRLVLTITTSLYIVVVSLLIYQFALIMFKPVIF